MIVNAVRENKRKNSGFDARHNQYVNMIEASIIDPAKVVRSALEHAASIAGLLTRECIIVEDPESKRQELASMPKRRNARYVLKNKRFK